MTYKFTSRWNEDGAGITTDIFVVSDTYGGLSALDAATEVENDIVDWDNTKHDLEAKSGEFVSDELAFIIDETRAKETVDWDAIAFILAAQDNTVKRFCARVINPASTATVPEGDFEFRGRIVSDMSGEDMDWEDVQYGSAINPLRVWDCTAMAFDAGYLIDKPLFTGNEEAPGLFELLDSTWLDTNFKDYIGYSDWGAFPRVAAWANLCPVGTLFNKLLELASSDGVTLTFDTAATPHRVAPARFRPWEYKGIKTRYVNYTKPSPLRIWPYEILDDINPANNDNYVLRAGGDGTQAGDMLVGRRLLFPSEEEKNISWQRFGSLRELLYEFASDYGLYVSWIYDSASEIRCKFVARDSLVVNDVFLRDATKASINIRSVERQGEKERYVGVGTRWTREGGYTVYNYDGYGFRPSREALDGLPGKGRLTATTISPTVCLLQGRGDDAGVNSGEIYSFSLLPHGSRFRTKDGSGNLVEAVAYPNSWTEYSRAELHSAIYVMCPRHVNDFAVGITTGTLQPQPVARIITRHDGADLAFDTISGFKNWIYGLDESAYDNEYTITVPGLNQFKFAAEDLAPTWKAAGLAARLNLDGIDWVLLGVQRNKYDTELRVHTADRYDRFAAAVGNVSMVSMAVPVPPNGTSAIEKPNIFTGIVAAEEIEIGQAIAIDDDGLGIVALPIHTHIGRVIGIATQAASAEDLFQVQTSGRLMLGDGEEAATIDRVFVSEIAPTSTYNWSTVAPTVALTGFLVGVIPLGYIDQFGFFNIQIERGFSLGNPSV